jgi:hypothetical protein
LRQPIWPEVRDSPAQRLCDCETNRKTGGKQNSLKEQVLALMEHVFEKSKYLRRYNKNEK